MDILTYFPVNFEAQSRNHYLHHTNNKWEYFLLFFEFTKNLYTKNLLSQTVSQTMIIWIHTNMYKFVVQILNLVFVVLLIVSYYKGILLFYKSYILYNPSKPNYIFFSFFFSLNQFFFIKQIFFFIFTFFYFIIYIVIFPNFFFVLPISLILRCYGKRLFFRFFFNNFFFIG